ncbi:hypothetical protein M422DRAFT_785865, partial [Sphaerobolus stellatus SS14]
MPISFFKKAILCWWKEMLNPLSWVMEAAALVGIVLSNGQHRPQIGKISSVSSPCCSLTLPSVSTKNAMPVTLSRLSWTPSPPRLASVAMGTWREIDSAELTPGDMIAFKIGDVVPADCRLTEAINVSIDQAALTGESL